MCLLAFFKHSNLKINVISAWGGLCTPTFFQKPLIEIYSSEIPVYELILQRDCDRIFYYNGVTKHITEPSIIFLPHCMTDIINPIKREYRTKNYYDGGTTAFHFTCDIPLASTIEVFPCAQYINELQTLFSKLVQIHNDKLIAYESLSVSLLYQIFALIEKRNSSSYLPSEQYSLIKDSILYLDKNYLKASLDYSELANIAGISLTYFHRLFKKKTGLSPKQYILTKKLNHACNLLVTTHLSINEISEITGFSSAYYFSKIFKNHFSESPQSYRKNFFTMH